MPPVAAAPRPLLLDLTPVEVAARCRHLPGMVFFDTAREGDERAISIIAAAPEETICGTDWELLRRCVRARERNSSVDDGLPHGFAAGTVDYEGEFHFACYEHVLLYRHADQSWFALGDLQALFAEAAIEQPKPITFTRAMEREQFTAIVERAQGYIAAGDIYQVNLSHRLEAPFSGDAFAFYEALRHYSPAPFAAYLQQPGRTVLSASPESFLRIGGRAIRTRPIKGTRPRRADPHADERSAYDLLTSSKELAELVMITDLERNDLGAICEYGSVYVAELLKLERHEQVFHLVSTVEGRLREDVDHVEALRRCFPGGSITGAPKKRAREIIAELEPVPRGLYTGAIGWFGFNGESQFSIAIRTAVLDEGHAHFHVGAGIVADSDPGREWQETLDKAAGILLAAEQLGRSR
jgi:aminodeoxychorismate synthase component I